MNSQQTVWLILRIWLDALKCERFEISWFPRLKNVKSVVDRSLERLYVETQFSELETEFWVTKGANLMNNYEGLVTDIRLNDRWKL